MSFLVLLLGCMLCLPPLQARSYIRITNSAEKAPAENMVQTLNSMSALLDCVTHKANADTAATELKKLHTRFRELQQAAEHLPPMTNKKLNRHLVQMDTAMNHLRLACARLMREKFYGSTALGKAVKEIAVLF